MRSLPILSLAALAVVLTACAAPSAGTAASGWAMAPRSDRGSDRATERPAERPRTGAVRIVAERPERPGTSNPRPSGAAPGLAAGLMIPVEGIEVSQLRDSFHAPRSGGRTHNAIDIAAPTGTPVVAVVDGRISRKHWNSLGGRTLYLTSADGTHDFYYAHLDAYADDVEIGTEVRRGDVLGTVGSTGNAQGPHLHFQVLRKTGSGRGTPVNPYDVLTRSPLYAGR